MNWPFIRRAPAEQRMADLSRDLIRERALYDGLADLQAERRAEWAAQLEAANRTHADRRLEWSVQLDAATARYDTLLERYHALRVEGANPAPPIIPAAPRPEPDPVAQAMVEMAKGSPVLMKQFRDFVNEQRAGGVLDMEIAEKLRRGESDDEGVP